MKHIILLVLCILIAQDIICNDSLLSKFHQNGYKIKDVRADLISYSKKHFNIFQLKTFKYNRTTPAINATMNVKVDMNGKVEVVVQVYKFLSNEYRHFPIRFQINVQKAMNSNIVGLTGIQSCGNVTGFIFQKDVTYHVCNFVIDETQFPPLIPSGRYKVDLQLLYLDKEVAFITAFGESYTPIAYPKN